MTKKAITEKCREILYRYDEFEFLSGEDKEFMLSLLEKHPYYKQKKGSGIEGIFVKKNPPYYTKSFWIKRVNGSQTDFSFRDCIASKKRRDELDFKTAMRAAIINDIEEIKTSIFKNGNKICPLCGKNLTLKDSHLDHIKKLREIQSEFIAQNEITDFEKLITKDWDGVVGVRIVDEAVRNSWIKYHKENATFRLLCPDCNRSLH